MLRKSLNLFVLVGSLVTAGLVASNIIVKVNPEDIREVTLVDTDKNVKEIYRIENIDPRVVELSNMEDKEEAKKIGEEIAKEIRKNYKPVKVVDLTDNEISSVKSDPQCFWRCCRWRWYNPCVWNIGWSCFYPCGGWYGWGWCW